MKKMFCPFCGKELELAFHFVDDIDVDGRTDHTENYDFFCDDCDVDITVLKHNLEPEIVDEDGDILTENEENE